jgi:hypothetical protein
MIDQTSQIVLIALMESTDVLNAPLISDLTFNVLNVYSHSDLLLMETTASTLDVPKQQTTILPTVLSVMKVGI